jgi:signal transduction histidine kinase
LKRHDELASLGADFNSMVERIEILLGSHKSLLASVSHELRSPLTRLSVSTALLRNGDERDRSELLDRQDRDVDLIDGLIEQLVTLSRFEMGNTSGKRETVDLTRLLEQVVMDGDFEATAQDKRVTLSTSELVIIDAADDFALRSGCENVIRNAIRFTPPGETVEVQLSLDRAPSHPEAVITISDRGPGVPEHLLSMIFTPFFRVSSTVPKEGHNGLGLAIVAGAVQMHRGQAFASNRAGGGLCVVLRFPL